MKRVLPVIASSLLILCLLCGCRPSEDGAAVPSSAQQTAAAPSQALPETDPDSAPTDPEAADPAPQDQARVFTEEDFHFYLGAEGEQQEGKINVAFYPDNRDDTGAPDPDIRVWNSWQITDEAERREICRWILACSLYDPALYGRTLESMLTEWQAHNDLNALYDNERTRHVDFNRSDEGVSYGEFWDRAVWAFLGR